MNVYILNYLMNITIFGNTRSYGRSRSCHIFEVAKNFDYPKHFEAVKYICISN